MKANVYGESLVQSVLQQNGVGEHEPSQTKAPAKAGSARWLIAALLIMSAIPLAAGAFRLSELIGGAEITAANARFFASPWPVVLHIVSAAVFAILGPFQFATRFRRLKPGWHRIAGRLLVGCGLLVGLSALWMTLFYPRPASDGELLYGFRLVFGSAMVVCIVLGFGAIRRGDVKGHRSWMMRGYALGLGAGTQVLTLLVGELIGGPPNKLSRAFLMGAAWVINLAVAEWAIRKCKHSALPHPARLTSAAIKN